MSNTFYIFNPEHDLALANSDGNFMAPLSARKLAHDLSMLPLWFCEDNSVIYSQVKCNTWLQQLKEYFPGLKSNNIEQLPDFSEFTEIKPWGWDKAVCRHLSLMGAPENMFPDNEELLTIRKLSHRLLAVDALQWIKNSPAVISNSDFQILLPDLPLCIENLKAAEQFAGEHKPVVFKAPWSGSGKGLSWVKGNISESHRGWIRNTIDKQGMVIGEKVYSIVENFAMEFVCSNYKTEFAGYSLFEAEGGIYRSNFLLPDNDIKKYLVTRCIKSDYLEEMKDILMNFIQNRIALKYSGPLGVDMFIYEESGIFKLHPCVEINLRMTMGYVARIFFDRYVLSESKGRFFVDHNPVSGELYIDHIQRITDFPLIVSNGKIKSGYLSLTLSDPHIRYRVRVEISE